MGYPMGLNLRKALPKSSALVVCEINQKQREKFVAEVSEHGIVKTAESPKDVAEQSDFIITMLPKGPHVLEVFTNPENGLLSLEPSSTQKFFLDCSTIDTPSSSKAAEAVKQSGLGRSSSSLSVLCICTLLVSISVGYLKIYVTNGNVHSDT